MRWSQYYNFASPYLYHFGRKYFFDTLFGAPEFSVLWKQGRVGSVKVFFLEGT